MLYFVVILFAFVFFALISAHRHRALHPNSTEPPPWVARLPLLPFVILSAVGFVLSVIVHGLAIFGVTPPGGDIVFVLHIGIFIIWIPAVMLNQRHRKDFLDRTPAWMKNTLAVLGAYAILNFGYFLVTSPKKGSAEAKAHPASPKVVRGFSGHWMIFYGAGFAMLWCAWKERRGGTHLRCLNGHVVPPLSTQCPTCGAVVPGKPPP